MMQTYSKLIMSFYPILLALAKGLRTPYPIPSGLHFQLLLKNTNSKKANPQAGRFEIVLKGY